MAKQMRISGTEGGTIKELDELAEKYAGLRDRRQQELAKEVECRHSLEEAMAKHRKKLYRADTVGLVVEIVGGQDKAKVRRIDGGEEE